jgi:transcription elongation factor
MIKDARESTCKIQLHAKYQTITVNRNRVIPITYVFYFNC